MADLPRQLVQYDEEFMTDLNDDTRISKDRYMLCVTTDSLFVWRGREFVCVCVSVSDRGGAKLKSQCSI